MKSGIAALTPSRFTAVVRAFPPAPRYWVAYSGGCDSHVLLHLLSVLRAQLPGRLAAVHVDHGLSMDAPRWVAHCRRVCRRLSVPLEVLRVEARNRRGESPEAAARRARYQALAELMAPGECLLTAHHRDDQAETLLLQLLRGSGPRGLAAMPARIPFAGGMHLRPLLDFERAALRAYARREGLEWVEDESNFDAGIRRNFLRHQVLPLLRQHWPRVALTFSRSAAHCAEAAQLLDELAAMDLEAIGGRGAPDSSPDPSLDVAALQALPPARRRNLLRYWLRGLGLPQPQAAQLQRIEEDLLGAGPDRQPAVHWAGVVLRRHRGRLHVTQPLPPFDASIVLVWSLSRSLELPGGNGRLEARPVQGRGLAARRCGERVQVCFRRGGERCRMAGGRHHSLKKLLQEKGVPPWIRDRLPLICVAGEVVAVADLWRSPDFEADSGEQGWEIHWHRRSPASA